MPRCTANVRHRALEHMGEATMQTINSNTNVKQVFQPCAVREQ